ncbi:MAG: site-specific DNA-methyltransferase [Ignavibacteriaceae bacterium]|nr:site-specific DNA-methyltransferase [Ignavibacteriaceae bacterium]
MINSPLPRIDKDPILTKLLLPYCRLKKGMIWIDEEKQHKVACIDACDKEALASLFGKERSHIAIQDPPYNFVAFSEREVNKFIDWCRKWVENTYNYLRIDSSFYVWLGADQKKNFQPFPQFILMMNEFEFKSRSFITMRNQRGFGTQKNWMSIRQELLYYTKGNPKFYIEAEYTDIPKVLRGYYKKVNGRITENSERSKSENIRAGNVWVDIQQVFYRMEENVNGCFAQKPLKAIIRIIESSTKLNDLVTDYFSHSGTTLLASEITNRKAFVSDIDPVFCEISIRRLEHFRQTGKTGWQNSNPFYDEIKKDATLRKYLSKQYKLN